MIWLGLVVVAVAVFVAARWTLAVRSARRAERLDALDHLRRVRHAAEEDLAALKGHGLPDAVATDAEERVRRATQAEEIVDVLALLRAEIGGVCALNPGHGPAVSTLPWAPALGSEEQAIPVCARCAPGTGEDVKLVRRRDRYVPWFCFGSAYDAYAHGWFGDGLDDFREESARLTAWDLGGQKNPTKLGRPTVGAGWYGVLLAAHHRMGKYSS